MKHNLIKQFFFEKDENVRTNFDASKDDDVKSIAYLEAKLSEIEDLLKLYPKKRKNSNFIQSILMSFQSHK